FLNSFISCHKANSVSSLIDFFSFEGVRKVQALHPSFNTIASEAVRLGTIDCGVWMRNNVDISNLFLNENHLFECGIIDRSYVDKTKNNRVLVTSKRQLKRILNLTNGYSLLSEDDKNKINSYLKERKEELIADSQKHVSCEELSDANRKKYNDFFEACIELFKCDTKWEIVSSIDNDELKSSAKTLIDRKKTYSLSAKKQLFNYVKPDKNTDAVYLNINNGIYIYPKYVICVKDNFDFDIIDINQFEIKYKRSRFIEEKEEIAPKDAKFACYTYQYINKNGSPDARYSYNPRYPVYEYGDITFKNLGKTIQFSNSDTAERFYNAFQDLKEKTNNNEITAPIFGTNKEYFRNAQETAKSLCTFFHTLLSNDGILQIVDEAAKKLDGSAKDKLNLIFFTDLIKCYNAIGHNIINLRCAEGLPLALAESYVINKDLMYTNLDYRSLQHDSFTKLIENIDVIHSVACNCVSNDAKASELYIPQIIDEYGDNVSSDKYKSLLYRFFSVVAKADGTISEQESLWLESLMSNIEDSDPKKSNKNKKKRSGTVSRKTSSTKNSPISKLQSLIGLNEVKKEVMALTNFVKIQKEREAKGLKSVGLSYHCVFTGNPGTGKTTVARILAEIYKNLGIIKSGHLIETDRSGLVAEYVGQTAVKTNKIIDSAIDGVLFIDEAYSLVQGENNDFGIEAIATLLKRMEDDRDRLVVVLAGYSNEMKDFIDSNPGLQSRFNRYINFEDYSKDELKEIFKKIIVDYEYKLSEESEKTLDNVISEAVANKDKNFGNGRYVRNLFEKTIQNQAVRLSKIGTTTVDDLTTICPEDILNNK
ncbi:MAG: AAA family ATPase, partial [Bacteroidales bacterium]|nr:AAA family ATPase [Candidatus Sodaliphilus fimicaballi]